MRIQPNQLYNRLAELYGRTNRNQPADKTTAPARGAVGDAVEFTAAAKEIFALQEQLANIPPERLARLRELASAIAEGRYEPSAEAIADRLLAQKVLDD